MNVEQYVTELRAQLAAAAGTDEETRALAERLSLALDAAARLVVLGVLSDAASEITREIAPGSVDVVLRDREPHLVVTRPAESTFAESTPATTESPVHEEAAPPAEPYDDSATSRTTLRLPDRLKARVEQAATEDGLSVNSWLVRAIGNALEPKVRRAARRETRGGDSFTGWAR